MIVQYKSITSFAGSSNAELTCYECAGKNDDCPHIIDTLNNPLEPVECQGVLSTVCTKFSIEYLSGKMPNLPPSLRIYHQLKF